MLLAASVAALSFLSTPPVPSHALAPVSQQLRVAPMQPQMMAAKKPPAKAVKKAVKKAAPKKVVKKAAPKKVVKKVVKKAAPTSKKALAKPVKKVVKKAPPKKVVKKVVKKAPPARPKPSAASFKPNFETVSDLQALALEQNTALGFWDPIGLSKQNFWDQGEAATIGFLRHAEIKHGRVAMAAFVGYCVQANGITWPWAISGGPLAELFGGEGASTVLFSDIAAAGSPPEQWDAVPAVAKAQILIAIAIFEFIGETPQAGGMPHYMRGGKPGYFPPLKSAVGVPHPVPFNLYDPFDLFADMDEETKARRRNMEINNGRLAMLGIFSFLSASKGLVVPGLDGIIQPYDGEYMAYFASGDVSLPFVTKMLEVQGVLAGLSPITP